ncbi:MAG: GDSL-type esterase/lipase family protein [Lysinibacillus sp.]
MGFRHLVLTFLVAFILCGCSIAVDPVSTNTDEDDTTNQNKEENDTGNVVTEFINQFFEEPVEEVEELEVKEPRELHYLALGDSLTDGVGDEYLKDGYVGRIADTLDEWPSIELVSIDNRGKRGRRSDQLLKLLEKGHYDEELKSAEMISMTIGGNDVMKVVKADLFNLKRKAFKKEQSAYEKRYIKIVEEIRKKNPTAPLLLIGFYNPFSIVTNEVNEFDSIIHDWNKVIKDIASEDSNACYVTVEDLFESNDELVYHTDFFHPNGKGYEQMANRIVQTIELCGMEQQINKEIGFEE